MKSTWLTATYQIETPLSLEVAAEMIATEQSTGTFIDLPGETEALRLQHRARVKSVTALAEVSEPALPGAKNPRVPPRFRRGLVAIDFPFANVGPSIPNLLATVAGNLFELQALSGVRLVDIELPSIFREVYRGPQFGVQGTREILTIEGRPVIGTIIKPSIGLTRQALRDLVRPLAESGIDFIKDDETNGDPPYFPFSDRLRIVTEELERARQRTGKQVMYACNITGEVEDLVRRHDEVAKAGGNAVMVSVLSGGWGALQYLRTHSSLPFHGHRNQWGAITRYPWLGFDFRVFQKLCRMIGVDHLHTNGLHNKFYESDASVVRSAESCLAPWLGYQPVMPVLASGQWGGLAEASYRALHTVDVMHLAGGGIMAHPGGVAAGVESMRQGWEAALAHVPLAEYAKDHRELAQAMETFGRLSQS